MIALNEKLNYQVTTASRVMIGSKVIESVQDRWVELKLTDKNDQNLLFGYTLLDQTMEGNALIHQWAEDMEWVQSPLFFLTDLHGKFAGMQGLQQIKERWDEEYRYKLAKKHKDLPALKELLEETDALLNDKKRLVQNFIGYSHYRAFFQPIYNIDAGSSTSNYTINNFFGKASLPLIVDQETRADLHQMFISNSGVLDRKNFDAKFFNRMLKDLTNTYNLKIDLSAELQENYTVDDRGLESADLFLECYVPDFYQITNAHQIKRI